MPHHERHPKLLVSYALLWGATIWAAACSERRLPDGDPGDAGVVQPDRRDAQPSTTADCSDSGPSFAFDVMPILQKHCSNQCHRDGGNVQPYFGPEPIVLAPGLALEATPMELDTVHARILEVSERVALWIVRPGEPEVSLLLWILDKQASEPADVVTAFHPPSSVPPEERDIVRDWIASGACNDSYRVPEPEIVPLLRTPLRLHVGRSDLSTSEIETLVEGINATASAFGICFDVAVLEFEQDRATGLDLHVLAWDESSVFAERFAVNYCTTPGSCTNALPDLVEASVLALGVSVQPTQRNIILARFEAMRQGAVSDVAITTCDAPTSSGEALCSGRSCMPYDTGYMDITLPPCCPTNGGCGVEPLRVAALLPNWNGDCNARADLSAPAPADAPSCTSCDDACPTLQADLPIVGTIELPGCCRYPGECGVEGNMFPAALGGQGGCLDGAQLEVALAGVSPTPAITVASSPCTWRVDGGSIDARCPDATRSVFLFVGCCTPDNQCGVVSQHECVPRSLDNPFIALAPLACDAAGP